MIQKSVPVIGNVYSYITLAQKQVWVDSHWFRVKLCHTNTFCCEDPALAASHLQSPLCFSCIWSDYRANIELRTSTCNNTEIRGRATHLTTVAFCHFLLGAISKWSLVLPQAKAAIDSCVCAIKGMKDKPARNGELEDFLSHTVQFLNEIVVQQDKAQRENQMWLQYSTGRIEIDESCSSLWEVLLTTECFASVWTWLFSSKQAKILSTQISQPWKIWSGSALKAHHLNSLILNTCQTLAAKVIWT